MRIKVVGTKIGKFTDKDTGEVITYGRLFGIAPFETNDHADAPTVDGNRTIEIKAKPDILTGLKVDSMVNVYFDEKGRLDGIEPVAS